MKEQKLIILILGKSVLWNFGEVTSGLTLVTSQKCEWIYSLDKFVEDKSVISHQKVKSDT